MSEATPSSQATPSYGDTDDSNQTGSGTPAGEDAANQPAGQPEMDHREVPSLPASGTVTSGDPQAASPARITREAEIGAGGVLGTGATVMAQGQTEPPTPPEGSAQPDLGVADSARGGVPNDAGRKAGASTASDVVGAQRPHGPDGEVGPA